MIKKLLVYDWKVIARDDEFRKWKKIYLLEVEIDELPTYSPGTEINFGNGNVARVTKQVVDLVNNIEYTEAVALDKWII